MAEVAPEVQQKLMHVLQAAEEKTDMVRLAVINRAGMRMATASSATVDADAVAASASALLELGEKMTTGVRHGELREILLRNEGGYGILMAISEDYVLFGMLGTTYRIGYYLGYLRNLCLALAQTIKGGLTEEDLEFFQRQAAAAEEEPAVPEVEVEKPSTDQDREAMEAVMSFLDDWGGEDLAPEPVGGGPTVVGISEEVKKQAQAQIAAGVTVPGAQPAASPPSGTDESAAASAVSELAAAAEEATPSAEPDQGVAATAAESAATTAGVAEPEGAAEPAAAQTDYGIPIYEDEVPPVPLDDVATDFVAEGAGEASGKFAGEFAGEPAAQEPPVAAPEPPPLGPPPQIDEAEFDFEAASEYDEVDLELDESDAMSEALSDLEWMEEDEE
ncbi:MAG: hypothetical protein Kow0069_08980 [Promethearchaeota archaeon]